MTKKKPIKQSKAKLAFRKGQSHRIAPLETLSKLRKSTSIADYKDCIRQFCIFGSNEASVFLQLGKTKSDELVGHYIGLEPLPLRNELYWAAYWLETQTQYINKYLQIRVEIQDLILEDKFHQARELIDLFIEHYGWTFWAIELRCIVEYNLNGMESLSKWLAPLKKASGWKINGLIYEILSDRCDDTFSFYAFYSKCQNSFPRIKTPDSWVIPYLEYRAFNIINNVEETIPLLLSKEITSSLIDYYEIFIEALLYIQADKKLDYLKPSVKTIILKLIDSGIEDYRLNKLLNLFVEEDKVDFVLSENKHDDFLEIFNFTSNNSVENSSSLKNTIGYLIEKCEKFGNSAQDETDRLFKIAVNYKSLDIGQMVLNSTFHFVTNEIGFNQSPNHFTFNEKFTLEDITTFSFESGLKILKKYNNSYNNDIVKSVISFTEGKLDSKVSKNIIFLWLANYLFLEKEYETLDVLLDKLNSFGGFWSRESAKFKVAIFNEQDQITEAIDLINKWLIDSPRIINEFKVSEIFENRKWNFFRDLDCLKVGLISHYTFQLTDIAGIGYICKMACRSILVSGIRENINSFFYENEHLQSLIIHFFSNVWIDENLSLCNNLDTTEKIRQERIEVLQLLLQWDQDKKNSSRYTGEIKDLTFDQTLQKGLKKIDQTRVFVNESAISRWAESEILPDFNRWMTAKSSLSGTRIIDDIISQFSVDPNHLSLLQDMSDGQPNISSAMLIDIIDRLYKRFLSDPTDGLDCYLSLRIRHGSLRGTILGPLEENRLLYFRSDISTREFLNTWENTLEFNNVNLEEILSILEEFSKKVKSLVDELVNDYVQINSNDKPKGAFKYRFNSEFLRVITAMVDEFGESDLSFTAFLSSCYFLFWKFLVDLGLRDLNLYIANDFKEKIKNEFDQLILNFRSLNSRSELMPLITMIQRISTDTQTQCDVVSDWFRLPTHADDEDFQLPDAINIAQAATQNVYRALDATFHHEDTIKISLTTTALAVITDCLFVIFENAWKHSGLGSDLKNINIETEFDDLNKFLTLTVYSDLSEERKYELTPSEISRLKQKYIDNTLPVHLVSKEGGSGFPKLRRIVRSVKKNQCPNPFDFGLRESRWFVQITIQLFEREGRFEAHV